jgi:ribonuclease HIII
MQKNSYTYTLTPAQQEVLVAILEEGNYRDEVVPHTRIAVSIPDCRINLYNSGKCCIQGKASSDFVMFTMEPLVLLEAGLGTEDAAVATVDPEQTEPHLGVDESGKGDFFGPLVIAAAYIDEKIYVQFKAANVRDCKEISSDKVTIKMAADIRNILKGRYAGLAIGNPAYNRMYGKMSNVNRILAWGHATAIEGALEKVPDCPKAIADKFGPEHRIKSALKTRGKKIELIQRTKAESDLAVAAASVLARANFLEALDKIGKTYNVTIPKGCSAKTVEVACELVRKHGPGILPKIAKCHFRTTDKVLEMCGYTRNDLPKEETT